MDDLIYRADAINAANDAADDWDGGPDKGREKMIRDGINAVPSALAVPLDKLCEWLEENAEFPMEVEVKIFYEPTEEPEIILNRMPNDAERWREKLTKWMEGLDDHR